MSQSKCRNQDLHQNQKPQEENPKPQLSPLLATKNSPPFLLRPSKTCRRCLCLLLHRNFRISRCPRPQARTRRLFRSSRPFQLLMQLRGTILHPLLPRSMKSPPRRLNSPFQTRRRNPSLLLPCQLEMLPRSSLHCLHLSSFHLHFPTHTPSLQRPPAWRTRRLPQRPGLPALTIHRLLQLAHSQLQTQRQCAIMMASHNKPQFLLRCQARSPQAANKTAQIFA